MWECITSNNPAVNCPPRSGLILRDCLWSLMTYCVFLESLKNSHDIILFIPQFSGGFCFYTLSMWQLETGHQSVGSEH